MAPPLAVTEATAAFPRHAQLRNVSCPALSEWTAPPWAVAVLVAVLFLKTQLANMPWAPSEKSSAPPPTSPDVEATRPLAKVMAEAVRLPFPPVMLKCLDAGGASSVTPALRLDASKRSRCPTTACDRSSGRRAPGDVKVRTPSHPVDVQATSTASSAVGSLAMAWGLGYPEALQGARVGLCVGVVVGWFV
jgi:hypothetical protein